MKLYNIGFTNLVNAEHILSVVSPDSAPVKRIIQNARDTGRLIDASQGRKTQSVIIADSGHIILSCLTAARLAERNGETIPVQTEDEE